MSSETQNEIYLGDGLYASFDGWQIMLRAPRGIGADHWVALEPNVYAELVRFARDCWERPPAPKAAEEN